MSRHNAYVTQTDLILHSRRFLPKTDLAPYEEATSARTTPRKEGPAPNGACSRRDASSVVCYTPDEWARVKETAADPEVFKDSFAEWEAMAEHELSFVRSGLGEPVKVFVRADELLPWCLTHGKPNDAAARLEFAVQKSLEG